MSGDDIPRDDSPVRLDLAVTEDASASRGRWSGPGAGVLLSVVFHLWLLWSLSGLMIEDHSRVEFEQLDTQLEEEQAVAETEPLEILRKELADPGERETPFQTTANAASIGLVQTDRPRMESAPVALTAAAVSAPRLPMYDIPEGLKVSDHVVVQGTTGEGMIQLNAALDKVTWEIAKHLQERKVLIVWLIDGSKSLVPQRDAIAGRLRRIYGELGGLEKSGQFARHDRPILTGVVQFGQKTNFLTREPTDDFEEIVDGFLNAPIDESGIENTFTAISQVMDQWHKYRIDHGRRILILTITDEAGDDHGAPLDLAIARCRRYGALGYVIGPAAPFGKRKGYVPYRAPEDGKTYQLPVDLGPESVVVENVDIPFWFDGPQYDNLSSGFGPYALSRFVRETGGVYFTTNMTTMTGLATVGTFDPILMKAFEPDYGYGGPQDFLKDLAKHPIRAAVFAAAQYSQTTQLKGSGTPRMEFRLAPNNFRQQLSDAQRSAAVSGLAIDNILAQMPPNVDKAYASEPSLRWRLAFSLNYGRLLAHKVRAMEYNSALAQLKSTYTENDISTRVNQLILRPDREISYAVALRKPAKIAEDHLQRVLAEAPGTPWAILAARELKDGFGVKAIERYNPPAPPQPKAAPQPQPKRPKFAPEPKKAQPATKPAPPKPPPALPKL